MDGREVQVTFVPSGRSVFALDGTLILEAAARAGIILQSPCGGSGTCGKCRVRILEGETDSRPTDHALTREEFDTGWRLACATRIRGPVRIEIPASSRFENAQRILTHDDQRTIEVEPTLTVTPVELPTPTQEDDIADVARLERALGTRLDPDETLLRRLPGALRETGWRCRLVRENERLLDIHAFDSPCRALGIAFDLGTTTVVGTLLNLQDGRELGVASALNEQIAFGDDVLSRILRVRENPATLNRLQQAAVDTLNHIVGTLCGGDDCRSVYTIMLAGNTTMQQLLAGVDPSALGELPFVPAFSRGLVLSSRGLGLQVNPAASLHLFPQVGGFVGGDTVAGLLAAGFDCLRGPAILVDIGTNGEIALLHEKRILCASTAAGPAFEGARITQGMRATPGAIEKVLLTGEDIEINVVGNAPAAGLCGTALIDAAAELLHAGVLDSTGRILGGHELPETLPPRLRDRIRADGESFRFVLAPAADGTPEVSLRQRDIRELQLASGALRAGIDVLLARCGLAPEDLEEVLLAGAFGNFIRRNNAQRIGLLPPIAHDRIRFIGNASSMGAKMALLSVSERERAESLAQSAEHVDLSTDPSFQNAFATAMLFPDGDVG